MITEYHTRKGNVIADTKSCEILKDIIENLFFNHIHTPFHKYELTPSLFFDIS